MIMGYSTSFSFSLSKVHLADFILCAFLCFTNSLGDVLAFDDDDIRASTESLALNAEVRNSRNSNLRGIRRGLAEDDVSLMGFADLIALASQGEGINSPPTGGIVDRPTSSIPNVPDTTGVTDVTGLTNVGVPTTDISINSVIEQADKSQCLFNAALPGCNSCKSMSNYPGCYNIYCEERLCQNLGMDSCCTDKWSSMCADVARAVCFPEVFPWNSSAPCPLGNICDEVKKQQASCLEIQEMYVDLKVGNIFGGIFCPEGENGFKNCPKGQYCPNPGEKKICPEGWFCPDKSDEPWIPCYRCGEGAMNLERNIYGWIFLAIGLAVILLIIIMTWIAKYNKDLIDHQRDLLSKKSDSFPYKSRRKQKQMLEKLRPKLEIIAKRLSKLEERNQLLASPSSSFRADSGEDLTTPLSSVGNNSFKGRTSTREKSPLIVTDDKLEFDPKKMYDVLDVDGDGNLSYEELNAVLELKPHELTNFVRRMQELGEKDNKDKRSESHYESVSRPVFVRYFLNVLEESNQLTVSVEEAAQLYDEIFQTKGKGYVDEFMLYSSSISNFLSDQQIYVLVKKFRAVRDQSLPSKSVTGEGGPEGPARITLAQSGARRRTNRTSIMNLAVDRKTIIERGTFINNYPTFLTEVTTDFDKNLAKSMVARNSSNEVVDICFKDLCLAVQVAGKSINVVDKVTGRIQERTMNALMGGSGAGKTSLLNALCGRAYYGEVKGEVYINGQLTSINNIQDRLGFVPQDDIVHAELTVRENLIYTGRFVSKRGTTREEIEELADETLASLGLSHVANSLVGDVKRRGVSGGEKKRVNIGLELMAKPACLFLDEPTSGLDSSSALLVMQSLRYLVQNQGVTIVSVIHQPRKFIFDLFDSLILLGVGGKLVYHGPTSGAIEYFQGLKYVLPPGESIADWLIDISSGRLQPKENIASTKREERNKRRQQASNKSSKLKKSALMNCVVEEIIEEEDESNEDNEDEENKTIENDSDDDGEDELFRGSTQDDDVVGKQGVSLGKSNDAFEDAKRRRAWLYAKWVQHFEGLNEEDRQMYEIPPESRLPSHVVKPRFLTQLRFQISRLLVIAWRNHVSKLIDTLVLIVATIVISVTSGFPEMTWSISPKISFEAAVNPSETNIEHTFEQLFTYALRPPYIDFPLKVGIIVAILIGLQATRILSSKRIEFFREAGSGYDINAYFLGVNIVATIEHSIQTIIAAFFATWIRKPVAHWVSLYVHFLLLTWICVSWGLLIPMVIPPDNVATTIGFLLVFFGLLCSGALAPITYANIYDESDSISRHIAAWLSPTRFFFEALVVGEVTCHPEQSGITISKNSTRFPREVGAMKKFMHLGVYDANVTTRDCNGWYWSVLPVLFIGLTLRFGAALAMHGFNRGMQTKKPLLTVMKKDRKVTFVVVLNLIILFLLGFLSTWLYTTENIPDWETIVEYGEDGKPLYENLISGYSQELMERENITPEMAAMAGINLP